MKKSISIAILLLIMIFSVGCWNQRELNDLAIAMAVGFDDVNDNEIELSIQVVQPEEITDPSYFTPVTVYSEIAPTIFEGFRKMTTESPRKIYLPHFRIAVISEQLARKGINDILDMLIRDHELRSDFYILIARDKYTAKDIISIMTKLDRIPANKIFSSLKVSDAAWAPTTAVLLDELLIGLATDGQEVALTGITIAGGEKEKAKTKKNVERMDRIGTISTKGISVFKDDKLVGWLNEDESKGYSYIMDEVQSTIGRINCPNGGELVVEIMSAEADKTANIKNGKPQIEISITLNVNIGEVACIIDLTDEETIQQLEKNMEEQLEKIVKSTVHAAQQKFNSDFLGFGNLIYKNHPKQWEKLKDNWDEEFPKLSVKYNMKGTINLTGTMEQSFFNKIKEE